MSTTHYLPDASGWASQAAGWGSSAAGRGRLRLKCQRSYDQSGNRSTLTFTLWAYSEYYAEASFQAMEGSSLKVGGTTLVTFHDGGSSTLHRVAVRRDDTWRQLQSGAGPNQWSVTLDHDDSGRLTAPVSLDLTLFCTVGGETFVMKWDRSCTFTVTEPRGSAIESVTSPVRTLDTLTVRVLRASTAHWHRATLRLGEDSLFSSQPFGESLSLPVPRSWFADHPSAAVLSCTLWVQTYTDESCLTALGQPRSAAVTLEADALMRPVLQPGYASAAPDNAGTAAENVVGFVSGLSRALVSLDGTKLDMSAAVGASVAEISVTGGGLVVRRAPYVTGVLTGTATLEVRVTDSRGRSAVQLLTVDAMPYGPPLLRSSAAFRCDGSGTEDEDGAFCRVRAAAACSDLDGQNAVSLSVALAHGGGSFGAEQTLVSGQWTVLGGAQDPDRQTLARFRAVDSLGSAAETTVLIPPRLWAMKFRESGLGVGFGMKPTEDCVLQLPAGWKIKIGGTVVAQG